MYEEIRKWSIDMWDRTPKEVNTDIADLLDKYDSFKYNNYGTEEDPNIGLSPDININLESKELLRKAFSSCLKRFTNLSNHNYFGADNCDEIAYIMNHYLRTNFSDINSQIFAHDLLYIKNLLQFSLDELDDELPPNTLPIALPILLTLLLIELPTLPQKPPLSLPLSLLPPPPHIINPPYIVVDLLNV